MDAKRVRRSRVASFASPPPGARRALAFPSETERETEGDGARASLAVGGFARARASAPFDTPTAKGVGTPTATTTTTTTRDGGFFGSGASSASDASRRVSRTTRDDEGAVGTSDEIRPAEGSTASPPTGLRAALRSAERHIAPKVSDESPATGSPAPSRRGPGAVTEGTDEIYTDFNGEKRFRRRARTTRDHLRPKFYDTLL